MQKTDSHITLSASDLSNHLGCRHLTQLNRQVADGQLSAPFQRRDLRLDTLRARGFDHELAYLEHLKAKSGVDAQPVANDLHPIPPSPEPRHSSLREPRSSCRPR